MDLKTGKILNLTDEDFNKMPEESVKYLLKLLGPAKLNCSKCHGLGHLGRNISGDGLYIPCKCVLQNRKNK